MNTAWAAVRTCTLAAAITFAISACGGGKSGSHAAAPSRKPPPRLAARCGSRGRGVVARQLWFRAADGTLLDGAELGNGPHGVVLLHESPADLCDWAPYGARLAARGFHVLLVDLRGFGLSKGAPSGRRGAIADVRGAVNELRRRGASKIALVGASYGGATAMVAAPALGREIGGVANLSGELLIASGSANELDALAAVRRLHVPFLVLASERDRFLLAPEARRLVRAAGSNDKRVVIYSGDRHGWDLLYKPPTRPADQVLVAFLRRVTQ